MTEGPEINGIIAKLTKKLRLHPMNLDFLHVGHAHTAALPPLEESFAPPSGDIHGQRASTLETVAVSFQCTACAFSEWL